MLYRFYEESGGNWVDLGCINLDIWSRPQKGQEIQVFNKNYTVSHCSPASNPENQNVTYYLIRI